MHPGPSERDGLERVLVLTARKGFWASSEAERFPHRVEPPIVTGHSTSAINTILLALRALPALVRVRPRVIVTGSAHRLVPHCSSSPVAPAESATRGHEPGVLRPSLGPLRRPRDRLLEPRDRGPADYRYLPIPADGDYTAVVPRSEEAPYVFSGGGSLRDFASLVAAVAGSGLRLVLVTDSPETLGVAGAPRECEVHWRMPLQDFLGWAAGALCVVVPLRPGDDPHGHTTVAQAPPGARRGHDARRERRRLRPPWVEGLLVDAGDVAGYRAALLALAGDNALRERLEAGARARAPEFSYGAFAEGLETLCRELLERSAESLGQRPAAAWSTSR